MYKFGKISSKMVDINSYYETLVVCRSVKEKDHNIILEIFGNYFGYMEPGFKKQHTTFAFSYTVPFFRKKMDNM